MSVNSEQLVKYIDNTSVLTTFKYFKVQIDEFHILG